MARQTEHQPTSHWQATHSEFLKNSAFPHRHSNFRIIWNPSGGGNYSGKHRGNAHTQIRPAIDNDAGRVKFRRWGNRPRAKAPQFSAGGLNFRSWDAPGPKNRRQFAGVLPFDWKTTNSSSNLFSSVLGCYGSGKLSHLRRFSTWKLRMD